MVQIQSFNSSSLTYKARLLAYLQLMRPANIVTAWADILAGATVAGGLIIPNHPNGSSLILLLIATTGLYGGGIVFNDVFDVEIDIQERPERPIPSGRVSLAEAIILGSFLLIGGIFASSLVSQLSFFVALGVALAALLYDRWGKHHPLISPLNMGLCRGGNLLLGVSIVPELFLKNWYLALIPLVYIAAITAMARGEVSGGKRAIGGLALAMLAVVLGSLLGLSFDHSQQWFYTLPFWLLFATRVLPSWIKATLSPEPQLIRAAVKAGVISLILLNATLAASFAGLINGLIVLILLPLSLLLARRFAVT
ncbi:UbiA prenyltransferase [Gloeothece citriformis PCC 7424]|uniref:UbiA prenyltransferase n=1 Tax=Gloeothece citriformis (strain PCC 7424) TaxID=65393 RepID=B7KHL3_GLOC7|nr:UbiA-like protein EboC [Gloeothece citriformis]ACK70708.1 UbiA prenyltransferase [Gloeothece citriformis PCC 7424]